MTFSKALRTVFICGFVVMAFARCATSVQSNVESAQFALDRGEYTTAIEDATAALADDPTSVRAGRILSSAYLGRSGINFLDVLEGLVDLANSTETNFTAIAGVLPTSADLDDLRSAITTIEALPGVDDATITDEDLQDAVFDLAIMQMIEHFALGVYKSDFYTTLDVTGITLADKTIIQGDLIDFDNRLIASGVASTEDFIPEIRQTYCILEPLSAGSGFTTTEYQALVACQLSADATTVNTVAIDPGIATCATLSPDTQGASVTTCNNTDTAL